MPQERWRLNESSLAIDTNFAGDGTNYYLRTKGSGSSSTTSSWEGSRAAINPTVGNFRFYANSGGTTNLSADAYYVDMLVFIPTGETGTMTLAVCSNDTAVEYSWVEVVASGGNYQARIMSYDNANGTVQRTTPITAGAINNWCRVRILTSDRACQQVELWTGGALPQPDGTNESATSDATSGTWNGGTFASWQYLLAAGAASASSARIDDILLNYLTAPTRQPPNVQAALSETVTLTSAASATRAATAAPSTTATMTALAGKVITAQAELTATASSLSDAAKITAHTAEAYLAAEGAMTPDTTRNRVADVSLTTAAAMSGRVSTNDSAVLTASASMTAWVRIDGEQSPGQLKSRVRTTTITG